MDFETARAGLFAMDSDDASAAPAVLVASAVKAEDGDHAMVGAEKNLRRSGRAVSSRFVYVGGQRVLRENMYSMEEVRACRRHACAGSSP
jgi:hypothetical protein